MDEKQPENQTSSGGGSPVIVLFLMFSVLGMVAAIALLIAEGDNAPDEPPGGVVNMAAPDASVMGEPAPDFQLTSITGELVSLTQFRGRPVFINLWWTGCPPCVREFPAFQQFMEEQGADGAVIIAINQGEELAPVRQFITDLGATDVVVLLDPDMQIPRSFPHRGFFPTTYLIDEQGIIRERRIGEITLDEMYTFLEAIQPPAG
ncbi:MAG: hypothetical protein EA396_00815 [Anaerolineaceae bacterium]|nr:MAG: hypothetical protein EA396_00815 [Anaerolineaceae bacterium]